jgi:hypothetical protein
MPSLLPRHARGHRHTGVPAVPYYGYGYNPAWPSIVSVAHDTADGAAAYVVTDRPCLLAGAAEALPVTFFTAAGAALPLVILSATQVLPVKFRLTFTGAVPAGATWQWGPGGGGAADLVDPITNHGLNAMAGAVADAPGPYTPPPPAGVTSAWAIGYEATLGFGQYLVLNGAGPIAPDGSIAFDGLWPVSISRPNPYTLTFTTASSMTMGSTWAVNAQPPWLATALAVPQNGTF